LANGLAFGRRPVFWGFVSKNPVKHGIAEVPNPRLCHLSKALEFELALVRETEVDLALVQFDERLCFDNIAALLRSAAMSAANVVRLNAYVTDRAHLAAYMCARDAFIAGIDPPPASTLMIVAGFAREVFKIEVEAIAAAAPQEESS
jgi:enamine deaminase RidA (YjgF/YER057c/UK114 family)